MVFLCPVPRNEAAKVHNANLLRHHHPFCTLVRVCALLALLRVLANSILLVMSKTTRIGGTKYHI
jgi:hypothetical protein